jgi:hypothetical protein
MSIRTRLHNCVSVPTEPRLPEKTLGDELVTIEKSEAPETKDPLTTVVPAATSEDSPTEGVFVTSQSLLTFPAASFTVVVIWKVVARVFPGLEGFVALPLVIAFLVGGLIYYISITPKMSGREKVIALGVAFINCFILAASALGIEVATTGQSVLMQ